MQLPRSLKLTGIAALLYASVFASGCSSYFHKPIDMSQLSQYKPPKQAQQVPASRPGQMAGEQSVHKKNYAGDLENQICMIIDDAGYRSSVDTLNDMIKAGIHDDITVALIPGTPYEKRVLDLCQKYDIDLILHQPMENLSGVPIEDKPGIGIYSNYSPAQAVHVLDNNIRRLLKQTGGKVRVTGINYHTGSKVVTRNPEILEAIGRYCAKNGLIMVDSNSIAGSRFYEAGKAAGAVVYERNGPFMLHEADKKLAKHYGKPVICIGHWQNTDDMKDAVRIIKKDPAKFCNLTDYDRLKRKGQLPDDTLAYLKQYGQKSSTRDPARYQYRK